VVLKNLLHHGPWQISLRHGLEGPELTIALAMIVVMEVVEKILRTGPPPFSQVIVRPLWRRWATYLLLLLGILCFGVFTNPQRFIYFAF
jgi:hypothetical protein